jgi:hypothetical protein
LLTITKPIINLCDFSLSFAFILLKINWKRELSHNYVIWENSNKLNYSYPPILATRWCGKNVWPKSSCAKIRKSNKNSLILKNYFYGLIVYLNIIFSFSYLINPSFIIYSWNTKKLKIFIMFERKIFNLNINLPKSKHSLCYACFENILLKTGFRLNRGWLTL